MKEIIGIIAVIFAYGLITTYMHGHEEYLEQVKKTEQVQKKLDEQKGVREANIKYMNDVVQTAQACSLIPFNFCPPQWNNLELANSYIKQGISGVPQGKYYSIISIAMLTKTLECLLLVWVLVKGWRWTKAPPKRKVIEAQAIIDKGEQWLRSIQAEMAPEREVLDREIASKTYLLDLLTKQKDALTESNSALVEENKAQTIRNEELRNEHEKNSAASEKLKLLFDKRADSSDSDDGLTDP